MGCSAGQQRLPLLSSLTAGGVFLCYRKGVIVELEHELDVFYEQAGAVFDRQRHELIEGSFIADLRRRFANDRLILYRHREWGTFVLGAWIVPPQQYGPGVIRELAVWNRCPSRLDNDVDWDDLTLSLTGAKSHTPMTDRIMARRAQKMRLLRETAQQKYETAKWARRKGMDELAEGLETGQIAFQGDAEGGERGEAMRKDMLAALKNRVVVAQR